MTVSTQKMIPSAKFPQYLAALIATLGGFCLGSVFSWTSPAESLYSTYYPFSVDVADKAWIGAIVAVGGIFGCPPMGYMVDTFGRKTTIILLTIPMFIGWMLIIFAQHLFIVLVGRFILGFTAGAFTVVAPLYTSEISENEIRGTLGTFFQLQQTIGITTVFICGSFLGVFGLSMVCAVIPVLLCISMLLMPDTPNFYLRKFKMDDARRSLQWFRGNLYDIEPELQALKANIDKMDAEKVPISQAFTTTPAKRGLVLGLGLMFFQQLSGVNIVIFYAQRIFKDAGSNVEPNVSSIIIGVVMIITTWLSTFAIDRAGRRPLLLISDSIMAVCTAALGGYFYIKKTNLEFAKTIGLLPVTSLSLYIIVFSLGYGPIPWIIMSEIFPPQIKSQACSIVSCFNLFCVFMVTKFYSNLEITFGSNGVFWIFAGISAAGTLFVWRLVPETKGKSMEEIQLDLGGRPQTVLPADKLEEGRKPGKY